MEKYEEKRQVRYKNLHLSSDWEEAWESMSWSTIPSPIGEDEHHQNLFLSKINNGFNLFIYSNFGEDSNVIKLITLDTRGNIVGVPSYTGMWRS